MCLLKKRSWSYSIHLLDVSCCVWGLFLDLSSRCHVPGGGAIAVSSIPSSSGFCTTSSITVIRGQKKKLVKLTVISTTQSVGWTSALCQTVNARYNSCTVIEHGWATPMEQKNPAFLPLFSTLFSKLHLSSYPKRRDKVSPRGTLNFMTAHGLWLNCMGLTWLHVSLWIQEYSAVPAARVQRVDVWC